MPCYALQDPKYDLKLAAQGKRSPHIREYVLPDGVHNLRGYVRTTTTTDAAAAVAADKAADGASAVGEDDAAGAQNGSRSARSREQAGQAPGSASAPAASAQDQVLTLNNELFMVPEALFRPSDIGLQQAGIHEAVAQAVAGCHPALAPMLFSHIILTGGCSQLPGFAERFRAELRPLVPDDYELGVVMPQVGLDYSGYRLLYAPLSRSFLLLIGTQHAVSVRHPNQHAGIRYCIPMGISCSTATLYLLCLLDRCVDSINWMLHPKQLPCVCTSHCINVCSNFYITYHILSCHVCRSLHCMHGKVHLRLLLHQIMLP